MQGVIHRARVRAKKSKRAIASLSRAVQKTVETLKNPGYTWDFLNGAKETRTPDPLHAMQVLYQLSYGPICAAQKRARMTAYTSDLAPYRY